MANTNENACCKARHAHEMGSGLSELRNKSILRPDPKSAQIGQATHHENEYLASQRTSEADGAACLFGLFRSVNHTNQSNREDGSA